MTRAVQVVALAARTPVGLRSISTAAAIRAGISRVAGHPIFVDANGEFVRCGYDARLGPAVFGADRLLALGRSVLRETAFALAAATRILRTVPVILALPEPR